MSFYIMEPRRFLKHCRLMKKDLEDEILRIGDAIDEQKKIIKKNVGNRKLIEGAEAEMRAMRTRLSVLEANLAKL